MKKIYIWLLSAVLVLTIFTLFLFLFRGVTDYIVQQYESEYLRPSHKDSLYMDLLSHPQQRPIAVNISETVQPFYFIADSTLTVLQAEISPQYIADILVNNGLAQQIQNELLQLDTSSIVNCRVCMDSLTGNEKQWLSFFQEKTPKELQNYLKEKINCVEQEEIVALKAIRQERLDAR